MKLYGTLVGAGGVVRFAEDQSQNLDDADDVYRRINRAASTISSPNAGSKPKAETAKSAPSASSGARSVARRCSRRDCRSRAERRLSQRLLLFTCAVERAGSRAS